MKILWIISSGWKEGGAENYLVALRPILEERGHVLRILSSDDRRDMPHFSDHEYHTPRGVLRPLFHALNFHAYRTLKNVLREFDPDIVHVHTIGHGSPLILFPLKKYPTVLTMHGPEGFVHSLLLWCFPASYFKGIERTAKELRLIGKIRLWYHRIVMDPLYAIGLRNVDTYISPGRSMQELIVRDGYTSVCLPNGTRLFPNHPCTKEEISHTIMFSGRLETYKGVDHLLRAFPLVMAEYPDARLVVVGDGRERTALESLARTLGIHDAVRFVGYVDRTQLEHLYAAASVAVMPSVGVEAFGLSGIEAMSVGRPVIASNIGGIPDWLEDGVCGFLVPPKDHQAIAQAIRTLFSDPVRHVSMMKSARSRALEFDIETHAEKLITLYERERVSGAKAGILQ